MRIAALALPLLAATATASLAADAFDWAAELVSTSGLGDGPMHTMDSWSYVDCGTAEDVVQLKSIKVSPDPPKPGANLTVYVEGDVLQPIEEGAYADVTVKLGLIKLLQKRFDVCEEARNANASVQCPVAPGPYAVEQTVELPKEIPKAKFAVQVRGFTADEDDLLCLDLYVDFLKKPGDSA
ncbi:Phosphatidylglycerol/phosphatidylinositol transfer protein [Cryptotrichosporon argae]